MSLVTGKSLHFFKICILHASTTTTLMRVLSILNVMTIVLPLQNINDFHITSQDILQKYYFAIYNNTNIEHTVAISQVIILF